MKKELKNDKIISEVKNLQEGSVLKVEIDKSIKVEPRSLKKLEQKKAEKMKELRQMFNNS